MSSKPPLDLFTPRGVAPRTPRHALSRAASPARSVRVARIALLARVLLPAPRLVRTGFQCRQQLLMNVVESAVGPFHSEGRRPSDSPTRALERRIARSH